ncbi:winged helix-turn-helix domain-containing protein [uncultured Psychroserpens sp.]|uniref:winged helix-turn-helix domain-containing protein n=1 Tax=uncultured Psychroserpens sp. TaxID=255436 RepID=UPI00262BA1FB|nr:winged helix-turn-helix domain-containing protein [uncultured Psychroserpens sp.]
MSKKKIYLYSILLIVVCMAWLFSNSEEKDDAFSERTKISLREVGNQLLLSNQDSTSLILPIIELNKSKYELSFDKPLSFEPNSLVSIIDSTFTKTDLPRHYLVEVLQCTDQQVAYSYQMSVDKERTIIPCAGRSLPESCYTIEVKFNKRVASVLNRQTLVFIFFFICAAFLIQFLLSRTHQNSTPESHNSNDYTSIGRFQFYPEQNKLVREAEVISLSKKECELLEIFVAHPNQIIKRDELTKKVWEDNGVFVGRSLDTYISKLRKKLKDDEAIKLTNVHGVGYKLEVE